jgi:hypothetical protein
LRARAGTAAYVEAEEGKQSSRRMIRSRCKSKSRRARAGEQEQESKSRRERAGEQEHGSKSR